MHPKLTIEVLKRRAVVYIRQSSPGQVVHNLESQRRQYGLADHARQLGFHEVQVIDEDLGRSGSGKVERPGFERLVAEVCSGEVGAVLCIEASRLARNGRDWHHLIELCGLVRTVVIDPDGIYDPCILNDRLLLGLKGSGRWKRFARRRVAESYSSDYRSAIDGHRAVRSKLIPTVACSRPWN
jgi:DNA invertase Pin-like site-specific DNA recombinase